jgi:putative intracellular protease/amidase
MQKQTAHLFVFDSLSDWEPCFAIVGINNPTFQKDPARYCIKTVGIATKPVMTMGGVTILPDMVLHELDPSESALLILPGGEAWDAGRNRDAIDKALAFLAAEKPVAAICGATAALARAGALDKRRHTSNSADYLQATGYQGGSLYVNEPAVTDGPVITAAGIAPIEFAHHIFRKLDLFAPATLEAWFKLFKTGNVEHFGELVQSMAPSPQR